MSFNSLRTLGLGPNCAADVGRKPRSTGASATKHPSHVSTRAFCVFCIQNSLIGKLFQGVERIKYNPTQQLLQMHQADYWRCFQQWKCLWNKLIKSEVFWFRRNQYLMKVTSVLLVRQHQSGYFLISSRGGTSGFLTLYSEGLFSIHYSC